MWGMLSGLFGAATSIFAAPTAAIQPASGSVTDLEKQGDLTVVSSDQVTLPSDRAPSVVIDIGGCWTRAGFANENFPRRRFRAFVGRPLRGRECTHVGDEAWELRDELGFREPVVNRYVNNWDDIEVMLNYIYYNQLRVDPTAQSLLMIDAPNSPKANRERIAELMFEQFGVPELCVALQPTMGLLSSGMQSGIVLDMGDGGMHAVACCEGVPIAHSMQSSIIGGRAMSVHAAELLLLHGLLFANTFDSAPTRDREIVRGGKEALAVCTSRPLPPALQGSAAAAHLPEPQTYTLPDGAVITIDGALRAGFGEVLFDPTLAGHEEHAAVHNIVFSAIQHCPVDLRRGMAGCVILTGGASLCPGLSARLAHELSNLLPAGAASSVEVHARPGRQDAAWMGGSIAASMSSYTRQAAVTKAEYTEYGASLLLHRSWG